MRKADVAETLLSLVGSAERARSFVGDLMEERERGRVWFWRSVTRLWLAMLGRDSPVGAAHDGGLLCRRVVRVHAAQRSAGLGRLRGRHAGVGHRLCVEQSHRPGAVDGPVADPLQLAADSDAATYLIQAVVLFAIGPFHIGRGSARFWRGHEVSLAVVMLVVWTGMAAFVPVVGIGITARPAMVPVMVMFVLAGALLERFRSRPAAVS